MLSWLWETQPLFITTPRAQAGPLGPRFSAGQKFLAVGTKKAPTRHDQAPEVADETRLALARTSMIALPESGNVAIANMILHCPYI